MSNIKKLVLSSFISSLLVAFFGAGCLGFTPGPGPIVQTVTPKTALISGQVHNEFGDVISEARVRVQTNDTYSLSQADGRFWLPVEGSGPFNLTGCAIGYYCNGPVIAYAGDVDVVIELHAHTTEDNPDYNWLPSRQHPGQDEDQGCAACHSAADSDLTFSLPVDEWQQDAHSGAVTNSRFVTMYLGNDIYGNQSPPTRRGFNRDYGSFPLRPDQNQPYFGPGYKLDFPDTAGNCAACHAPAAAINDPYGTDPTKVSGVAEEGIPCDFCHKIWDANLDSTSGLPYSNMPGVLSFQFRRPPEGHQFFAGPLDDVAPGEDTFSPLQNESRFCAPCHFGVFWDTQVYNSFGEWLDSPYSDPDSGRTCQDCHMPQLGGTHFALPELGGLERDPETIFSHRMPGAGDQNLLQNAVSMDASARLIGDTLQVNVTITNDQTGHHVPTDSPLRHLILLVQATDNDGTSLALLEGPTLPDWCGIGDLTMGYYASQPGVAYAKVLEELWTYTSPSGAYWNPTRILSDNRIAAFALETSSYTFEAPSQGEAKVMVQLYFRRAFIELMDQKGWQIPDILMESAVITPLTDSN